MWWFPLAFRAHQFWFSVTHSNVSGFYGWWMSSLQDPAFIARILHIVHSTQWIGPCEPHCSVSFYLPLSLLSRIFPHTTNFSIQSLLLTCSLYLICISLGVNSDLIAPTALNISACLTTLPPLPPTVFLIPTSFSVIPQHSSKKLHLQFYHHFITHCPASIAIQKNRSHTTCRYVEFLYLPIIMWI